jgi:hypothetical protein
MIDRATQSDFMLDALRLAEHLVGRGMVVRIIRPVLL